MELKTFHEAHRYIPATTVPFNPPNGLDGGVLNPGSLDYAMANYTINAVSRGSVGFNNINNPIWAGAAEVARAGYQAQCSKPGSLCDPNNAKNVVSYKNQIPSFASESAAIAGIQNEICSGNPVMLKFAKAGGGQHFMLATGIVLGENGMPTLRLNNPGTIKGKNMQYSDPTVNGSYPTIIGGSLFHPTSDPTMMFLTAPLNVHFVVTDPMGRRTGYDPTNARSYSEIPGASYEVQSIDTPNEIGFTPQTLVAERYFVSSNNVLVGDYQIEVFAQSAGNYYVNYRGLDATGTTNKSVVQSGYLQSGQSVALSIKHSDQAAPVPSAKISLEQYSIHNFHRKGILETKIKMSGKIIPNQKGKISLTSDFKLMIGGVGEYELDVPVADFKVRKDHKETVYEYRDKGVKIKIENDGDFDIEIKGADLSEVKSDEIGLVTMLLTNIVAQTNSSVKTEGNECSLGHNNDGNDHRGGL